MTVTTRVGKILTDTKPLYAAVGVGGLAAEKLRHRVGALRADLKTSRRPPGTGCRRA
jgi:hypothetical protein